MKNQFFFRGLLLITGLLALGCNLDIPNELRNPEDLFAKKGGVVIHNLSPTKEIKDIVVIDPNTEKPVSTRDILLQGDTTELIPVKPNTARGLVLDPGNYRIQVQYEGDSKSPASREIEIKWKQNIALYFSADQIIELYGTLQVINFSGKKVVSVKLGVEELLLPFPSSPIEDNQTFTKSRMPPGNFKVTIQLEDQKAFPEMPMQICEGGVTSIMVLRDKIDVGEPTEVGKSNNLWIVNQSGKVVSKAEKKKDGEDAYSPLINKVIEDRGYAGVHLPIGTYEVQITLDGHNAPLTKPGVGLTNDPVFIILRTGADGQLELELVSPGDQDEDGFPDWWEREYFGPDAATDSNKPLKEGDEDGDKLTNWDEYLNGTNPKEKDTDSDGLTDWEELNGKKDPNIPFKDRNQQSDFNDIPDTFQKTNPLKPDTDNDGYSDYIEIACKSDPTNPLSRPSGGIKVVVEWSY
jgi:hypothetical protein